MRQCGRCKVNYIVFINDLPSQTECSVVDMYADDTTLSSAHDYSSAPQSVIVDRNYRKILLV